MFVSVIHKNGKILMPTTPRRARLLLKSGLAKIVRYRPFAIQMTVDTKEYVQDVTLGIDTGSKHLGLSVTTQKKEIYAIQTELRTDITELLSTRREARRARRNRKTRYRKARFLNRKRSEGRLPPSVQHKVDATIKEVELFYKYFPINHTNIEVAPFDIQKINNPAIAGIQYQQGSQLGFANVREYALYRDQHKCQCCGKSKVVLNVHHIESRLTGGDAPNNLITLCGDCHKAHHEGTLPKPLKLKRGLKFNDAIQVTIISKRLCDWFDSNHLSYSKTYGYITKYNRTLLGLSKSHCNDAFAIAGNLHAIKLDGHILQRRIRRNNRRLHAFNTLKGGKRKVAKLPKEVFGFQLWDKIKYKGKVGFVGSRMTSGYFVIKNIEGKILFKTASYKKLKLLERSNTVISEIK